MSKNNTVYVVDNNLYINLTNRCSNRCEFCVRYYDKPVYGDLWLEGEPTADEVIAILKNDFDLTKYNEVVFCGFGEPTYRFDDIVTICDFLHSVNKVTRINTNGQGSAILARDISAQMCKCIDKINISLNATDKEKYQKICHSQFGLDAFDIMIDFAKNCVKNGGNVTLSVVDCIGLDEIKKSQEIAKDIGAKIKVREML